MSFIKDDKGSSFWDWIILGVLVVGGLGFWYFYSSTKSKTLDGFKEADSLFIAQEYQEAMIKYQELKSAQVISEEQNNLIYERIDTLFYLLEEKKPQP